VKLLKLFYLWNSLKDKYNLHTLEELKNNIREEITKIVQEEFQHVNQNVFTLQGMFTGEQLTFSASPVKW
jgi:hypothetical protein